MAQLPRIGLTMGDPAGIGPEILLKALAHDEVRKACAPIIFGDLSWLRNSAAKLGSAVRLVAHEGAGEAGAMRDSSPATGAADSSLPGPEHGARPPVASLANSAAIPVVQATRADLTSVEIGVVSAQAGQAAAECVIAGARAALGHEIDALVTGPLNKESIALGGYPYPGHTEMLAEIADTRRFGMLLLSGALRVVHVSTHVSLREAIERVRMPRILECIQLGSQACLDLGITAPRIAVAGLNPHAGENGLFGGEEGRDIAPAIARAREEGIDASGPHPPDTVFARARKGEFDLVVAMYHDQGHIPVKLNGFDSGVNVTIGLPLIRVSVDHGTAFDIAGKGVAREESMVEAIRVAVQMVQSKQKH